MGKSSSAPEERKLTQTELDLLKQQEASLKQASDVAAKQYNLSTADREYVSKIYRGDLDASDPLVQAELVKRMENTPEPTKEDFLRSTTTVTQGYDDGTGDTTSTTSVSTTMDDEAYADALKKWKDDKDILTTKIAGDLGGKGVDELLFEGIVSSESRAGELLNTWKVKSAEMGDEYIGKLEGISDSFKNTLQKSSDEMGTASADIYAQTKAQNLAGISQAYQQASKEAMGTMSRRGLAGSGVEANVLGNIAGGQASASASALNQSYQQAIEMSDQRRGQQAGIAGQMAQTGQSLAQNIYGTQSGLEGQYMQNEINLQQQGLSNLQMGAGVAGGTFMQSQNYLNQAGQTSNSTAQIAGNTASAYGQMDNAYQMNAQNNQAEADGAALGAVAGLAGTGMMMMSDERLKTNLVLVGVEAGHNIYTWDWIEGFDGGYNKGVLAQEVMETNPEAVEMMGNGYYGVYYDQIGVTPESVGV